MCSEHKFFSNKNDFGDTHEINLYGMNLENKKTLFEKKFTLNQNKLILSVFAKGTFVEVDNPSYALFLQTK